MRSARRSAASRGSMLALALTCVALNRADAAVQAAPGGMAHRGAILVQAVDTSINPLAAEIVLPTFGLGVRLSEEGVVLLMNIPDGTYLVQARHLGHRPEWRVVRIAGDTARLDFILAPADLAGRNAGYALADSRLRDFLRRSVHIRQASFITRAEIERRRPRNLAGLLSRLPEIKVERAGPGPTVVRSRRAGAPGCTTGMLLFVDGMLSTPPPVFARSSDGMPGREPPRALGPERASFAAAPRRSERSLSARASAREMADAESIVSRGPTSARHQTSPLDWVPIGLVAGVEVYPAIDDVPAEFRVAGAECGAVLVWTVRR